MRQMRDRNFGDHTRQDAPPPTCPSPQFPQKSTFVYLCLSSCRIDVVDGALPCTANGSSRHVGDDRPVGAKSGADRQEQSAKHKMHPFQNHDVLLDTLHLSPWVALSGTSHTRRLRPVDAVGLSLGLIL